MLAFSRVEFAPEAKREIERLSQLSRVQHIWSGTVPDSSDYVKEGDLLFVKSANKVKRLCAPTDIRLRTRKLRRTMIRREQHIPEITAFSTHGPVALLEVDATRH